jgi:hypothetical protein
VRHGGMGSARGRYNGHGCATSGAGRRQGVGVESAAILHEKRAPRQYPTGARYRQPEDFQPSGVDGAVGAP